MESGSIAAPRGARSKVMDYGALCWKRQHDGRIKVTWVKPGANLRGADLMITAKSKKDGGSWGGSPVE